MEKLLDCHFINGALVPPAKGQYMDVINPADETVFGRRSSILLAQGILGVVGSSAGRGQTLWQGGNKLLGG